MGAITQVTSQIGSIEMRACMRTMALGILAAFLAGCSSGAPEREVAGARPGFVEMLRLTSSYSYVPYVDPKAMLDGVDVVFVGTVQNLSTAVVADELDGQGALLVGLRPAEMWKGAPETKGGLVYISLPRPKNVELSTYEAALPLGAEFVVFGVDHPPSTRFATGDPGVTAYVPEPQGLYVAEPPSKLTSVWADDITTSAWANVDSVEDLRAAALQR